MKKIAILILLVISILLFPRSFEDVVGYDTSNIIRAESRFPDGLYYSTDEMIIEELRN